MSVPVHLLDGGIRDVADEVKISKEGRRNDESPAKAELSTFELRPFRVCGRRVMLVPASKYAPIHRCSQKYIEGTDDLAEATY